MGLNFSTISGIKIFEKTSFSMHSREKKCNNTVSKSGPFSALSGKIRPD
jgi:hypothetical protein